MVAAVASVTDDSDWERNFLDDALVVVGVVAGNDGRGVDAAVAAAEVPVFRAAAPRTLLVAGRAKDSGVAVDVDALLGRTEHRSPTS